MSDTAPITIIVQYRADDYKQARRLYSKTFPNFRPLFRYGLYFILTFFALTLIVATIFYLQEKPTERQIDPGLIFVVGTAAVIGLAWACYNRFNQQKHIEEEPQTLTIDEAGIRVHNAVGESLIRWAYWQKAIEDHDLLLLLHEKLMYIIPKRAIDQPADIIRLRAIIERHVGPVVWWERRKRPEPPPPPARSAPPTA